MLPLFLYALGVITGEKPSKKHLLERLSLLIQPKDKTFFQDLANFVKIFKKI